MYRTTQFVYDTESTLKPLLSSVLKCDVSLFIVQNPLVTLVQYTAMQKILLKFEQLNCNENFPG